MTEVNDPETQTLDALHTRKAPAPRSGSLPIFLPGEIVAGRFEIVRFLGQGGMAQVFAAEDRELGTRVALKMIRPEIADRQRIIEAFKREVQLARQVTHPNVCRIFDLFHHASTSEQGWGRDGPPILFLTMELLPGETLTQRLRREGPLKPAEALPLIRQMAAALDAAHRASVVHRDFKTGNVMLVEAEPGLRAVVTDFGLARAQREGENLATAPRETTSFGGTPAYVAPEVVAGKETSAATDIYSLGVVIYEMLTGQVPFCGDTPETTARLRLEQEPPTPRQLRPELDSTWEAVILRCLRRHPIERFPSAGDAAATLGTESPIPRLPLPARRRGSLLGAGALMLCVCALILVPRGEDPGLTPSVAVAAPGPFERRPALAVLGFKNRAESPEVAWIGTTLAEGLSSELGADESLLMIRGKRVARMKIDLSWDEDADPGIDVLGRLQEYLGSDFVVLGSYTAGGSDPVEVVDVEVEVYSAASGTMRVRLAEKGRVAQLADLTSRLASQLRDRLGIESTGNSDAGSAHSGLPTSPIAARLYAQGLAELRRFNPLAARDLLVLASEAAPGSAAVFSTLASAWAELGNDAQNAAQARRAFELADELPREERLLYEARYREATNDWPRAVEIYRALWTVFSDNLEYGLHLASVETMIGSSTDALATLDLLRERDTRIDPRIDLAEAEAARVRGELERQLRAAGRAAKTGRSLGAELLLARARLLEAEAFDALGRPKEANAALTEARRIFEARGDRRSLALALLSRSGGIEAGFDVELGLSYEEARKIFREIGDRENEVRAIVQMVRPLMGQPESQPEAERLLHEALELARRIGNRPAEGETLNALGYLAFVRHELSRAAEIFDAAVTTARKAGNLRQLVENLQNAAATFDMLQNLDRAAEYFTEAIAASRRIDYRFGTGMTLRNSAWIHFRRGDLHAALEQLSEAAEIGRDISSEQLLALASYDLAVLQITRDELDLARATLDEVERLWQARSEGDGDLVSLQRAEGLLAEERYAEAEALLRELMLRHPLDPVSERAIEISGSLALTLLWQGKVAEAHSLIVSALERAPAQRWDLQMFCARIAALIEAATGRTTHAVNELRDLSAQAEANGQMHQRLRIDLFLALGLFADGRDADAEDLLRVLIPESKARGFALIARQAKDILDGRRRLPIARSPPEE